MIGREREQRPRVRRTVERRGTAIGSAFTYPGRKERLGRAVLLACGGKGNAGIFAEAEQLFLAVESVFEAPELRSVELDEEVQAAAVGQLEGPPPALGISDLEFLQRHLKVSPVCPTGKNYPQFKSTWQDRVGPTRAEPIAIECMKYLNFIEEKYAAG